MTVWKFELWPIHDMIDVPMPKGARLLHVDNQRGIPCLWAQVEETNPKVIRRIRFAGTGHPLEPNVGPYVGSFSMGLMLIFHIFHIFDMGERK